MGFIRELVRVEFEFWMGRGVGVGGRGGVRWDGVDWVGEVRGRGVIIGGGSGGLLPSPEQKKTVLVSNLFLRGHAVIPRA